MAYRNSGRGHSRRFGNQRRFGGPREMHKITCSECGKEAEVPFKPRTGAPVYCKECFLKKKGIKPRAEESEETEEESEEPEEETDESEEDNSDEDEDSDEDESEDEDDSDDE